MRGRIQKRTEKSKQERTAQLKVHLAAHPWHPALTQVDETRRGYRLRRYVSKYIQQPVFSTQHAAQVANIKGKWGRK
eukprot:scaffold135448_cov21-Tisochrysis_lutea.AAC.2